MVSLAPSTVLQAKPVVSATSTSTQPATVSQPQQMKITLPVGTAQQAPPVRGVTVSWSQSIDYVSERGITAALLSSWKYDLKNWDFHWSGSLSFILWCVFENGAVSFLQKLVCTWYKNEINQAHGHSSHYHGKAQWFTYQSKQCWPWGTVQNAGGKKGHVRPQIVRSVQAWKSLNI